MNIVSRHGRMTGLSGIGLGIEQEDDKSGENEV
jgi:hypothetical protein